ncbi:flagellar biosynthesis anti-sigma factor FlgM [Mangrovitalea sediminis]|uniref:flagellar biosynthesis anti-sigma factor FlgM n=1 Tax=Mangrovitalea sediminis TaxID=1982043 RepID=UPI000BE5ADBD|nr:flagellar biosynthesis anti-sigma factor FlgM [Mangrovitalea sediminis]
MSVDINGINSGQINPQRNGNRAEQSNGKAVSTPTPQEQAKVAASTPNASENVSLSSRAKGLKQTEQRLKEYPEVDDTKVDAIRTALQNGSFKVDAQKLAQKMLENDNSIFG